MHLLGLSKGDSALVAHQAEGTGQLGLVHLTGAGALPPGAGSLAQEQLLREVQGVRAISVHLLEDLLLGVVLASEAPEDGVVLALDRQGLQPLLVGEARGGLLGGDVPIVFRIAPLVVLHE